MVAVGLPLQSTSRNCTTSRCPCLCTASAQRQWRGWQTKLHNAVASTSRCRARLAQTPPTQAAAPHPRSRRTPPCAAVGNASRRVCVPMEGEAVAPAHRLPAAPSMSAPAAARAHLISIGSVSGGSGRATAVAQAVNSSARHRPGLPDSMSSKELNAFCRAVRW